jgi:hypothetical protein
MKWMKLLLMVTFLVVSGFSLQVMNAQAKTKEDQEREEKIRRAIVEQKKAMEEANRDLSYELDSLKNIRVEIEKAGKDGEATRIFIKKGDRTMSPGDLNGFPMHGDMQFFNRAAGSDAERTSWEYSRSVKENTFSKSYTFEVEKSANTIVISITGECKSGEISIGVIMPSGKSYSEIVIDEYGNLNWRKSFSVSESENQDKIGEWKFRVKSTKASGYFRISAQAY